MIQGAVAALPFIVLLSDELHQEYTCQIFGVGGAEQMRRSGQTGVPNCDHLLVGHERSVMPSTSTETGCRAYFCSRMGGTQHLLADTLRDQNSMSSSSMSAGSALASITHSAIAGHFMMARQ